jgi:hypothetical protein
MKRYLPILVLMLFAFAGCNKGPATYESSDESNIIKNSSMFVKQTEKVCSKYTAEEWENSTKDFVHMCKDFLVCQENLSQDEINQFSEIRIKYTDAVAKNCDLNFLLKTKDLYNQLVKDFRPS